jgi:hypothetical protein
MRRAAAAVLGTCIALLAAPAAADDPLPKRVKAKPKVGGTKTTFTVRFDSRGAEAFGSDYVWVDGPKGTRCAGTVINGAVGIDHGRQRLDFGPRVPEDPASERHSTFRPYDPDDEEQPLKRWCRGTYRGGVYWEHEDEPDEEVHTTFSFRVE